MPAFDPNLVLSTDPRVRAANGYQAVLNYVTARLTSGDMVLFLAEAASAGLPTSSDDVLSLPDASRYLDGISILALHFVTAAGRHINPSTLSAMPQVVADLRVLGTLTGAAAAFSLFGALALTIADVLEAGDVTVTGDADIGGDATVGGKVIINGAADPGAGGLGATGRVQGSALRIVGGALVPGTALPGDLGEDSDGDLWYIDQAGVKHVLNRPKHDTGWLATNPLHACLGVAGGAAPTPASTPDIYAATPMVLGAAEPGAVDGPTRIVAWVRCDTSLVDGGAATGNYYYFLAHAFGSGAAQEGVLAYVDSTTARLSIIIGGTVLVPGQPGIIPAATPDPEVRVMVWTR